jgi:hypothetical protein
VSCGDLAPLLRYRRTELSGIAVQRSAPTNGDGVVWACLVPPPRPRSRRGARCA